MAEMKTPPFLENQDVDTIHDRMMSALPDDMDVSEGSHPWNLTMPAAYEKAYMAEYLITEALKMIFPEFCQEHADAMESHAKTRGLSRKQPTYAVGEILITGTAGAEIPLGSKFSTISINDQPSIDFQTTEEAVIGEDGTVTVPIIALLSGTSGNVQVNTIVLNSSSIDGIASATNPRPTENGSEIEEIEDLQERIIEADQTISTSYGGNRADYKRWALSVDGTGAVTVIEPEDDSGVITLILVNAEGGPASDDLCEAVYNHIMRPDDRENRLAPINDKLSVVPPATLDLTISATIELETGATIEQALSLFLAEMQTYIMEAIEDREIVYSKIYGILSKLSVVYDHKDLTVNGGTANISISENVIPALDESSITFTEGTV